MKVICLNISETLAFIKPIDINIIKKQGGLKSGFTE